MTIRAAIVAAVALAPAGSGEAQTFEPAFAAWFANAERLISSVRVDTRQHSVSSEQTAVASSGAAKGLARTIVEMDVATQVREVVTEAESMQTGVAGLCANVDMAAAAGIASDGDADVRAAATRYERDWMAGGGSRAESLAATQAIRLGVMCSASEMELGLCEEGAEDMTGVVPAGDTNPQTWLLRRSYGTQEAEVGAIYVDTLAPPPTMGSAQEAAASVDALLRRAEARRQMALVSMARGAVLDVVIGGLEGGTE